MDLPSRGWEFFCEHANEMPKVCPCPPSCGCHYYGCRVATKQREGDQPLPVKNDLPAVQDLVLADIEARKALGIQRYGTLLQPFNGRDGLRDLYEELLDAAIYARQLLYERDKK